jgi:hypothetical protein
MTRYLVLALTLLTLAGCAGHPGAAASPSPTALTNDQILAIGREAAQCMRQHGIPDFPDPVIGQHGDLDLPPGPAGQQAKDQLQAHPDAQRTCEPILQRLPQFASPTRPAFTQEDLANLLKFAQCLRRNGIPEWPDPKADGTFPISGTPLATEGKSARLRAGMQACRQYWDKGIMGS